jgi:hypothetical protein
MSPIVPTALYDGVAARDSLGIPAGVLARARREGRLKFTRQGPRCVYLGQWLLDWIEREAAAIRTNENAVGTA